MRNMTLKMRLLAATGLCIISSAAFAQDYGLESTDSTPVSNPSGSTIHGAKSGVRSTGPQLNLDNAGTIRGDGTTGGSVSADGGIVVSGGPASITNSGDISGARFGITTLYFTNPDNSIEARAIGSVINNSGSIIGDNGSGVRLFGGGDVTNSGTIEGHLGGAADGITMLAFNGQDMTGKTGLGTVDNLEGGTILGARYGVILFGGGTIHNAGRISSTIIQGTVGSERLWSGDMTNSGTVDGLANFFALKSASLDNSGTIGGTAGFSQITNASMTNSGTVLDFTYFNYVDHVSMTNSGSLNDFLQLNVGDATVTNSGSIVTGAEAQFYGIGGAVFSNGALSLTNTLTGTITGYQSGVDHFGPSLTINNSGTIRGDGTVSSLTVPNAGIVFSGSPANITNSGTISGAKFGIASALYTDPVTNQTSMRAMGSTIQNSGSIIGDNGHGIRLFGGGSVVNSGYISGRSGGGAIADGISMFPSTDQPASSSIGSVTNQSGGTIEGHRLGVLLSGGGSVDNAGTITGDLAGIVIQSAELGGPIVGSLTNSGTITGGVEFINLDSGTLTNSSGGNIQGGDAGAIAIQGSSTSATASVTNGGSIAGSLSFYQLASATLSNNGSIVGGGTAATPDGSAIYSDSRVSFTNAGTLAGTSGIAATLSGFNDVVLLKTGSSISGIVDGGGGIDNLSLMGTANAPSALQTVGSFSNFETLNVNGGYWTAPGNTGTFSSTTILGGALAVNGSLMSPVSVASGALLAGTGTITGNTLMNGGSLLAPGGTALGTLSIIGNVAFNAGSTFSVQTNPNGTSDKLAVTGAVTIAKGSGIQVLAGIANYAPNTSYVVLTATGGIDGKFDKATTDYAYFNATVNTQKKGTITVQIAPNGKPLPSAATASTFSTASAVDALGSGNALYQSVLYQSLTGARQAFDALSGAGYARLDSMLVEDLGNLKLEADSQESAAPRLSWTGASSLAATGGSREMSRSRGPLSIFMAGGQYGTWPSSGGMTGNVDTRFLASAVAYRSGRFSALAGVTSAWHDASVTRAIVYPGFGERAQSRYRATTHRLEVGGQYALVRGPFNIAPHASYAHIMISAPAFAENGRIAALAFGEENRAIDEVKLGLSVAGRMKLAGLNFRTHLDADVERFWGIGDPARSARFAGSETSFESGALGFNRTLTSIDSGIDVPIGPATLSASYRARRGDQWSDRTARLTAALRF